tara:strand:+ start:85 stop:492 length:408 start_codon:yes stop_codon:yes gene_type:complete
MPFDKKEWRENNKGHIKEYDKEYYQNNKEYKKEQRIEYYQNNKGREKKYSKEYSQTEQGIKSRRIADWRRLGMSLDYDYDIIYDIYINCNVCDFCNVELVEGIYGSNKKCLDHNHTTGEIRGILCNTCNIHDVLE